MATAKKVAKKVVEKKVEAPKKEISVLTTLTKKERMAARQGFAK